MFGENESYKKISTHTPLARRDADLSARTRILTFLLTRLSGSVTKQIGKLRRDFIISTHTPLARRDCCQPNSLGLNSISTHTPLARRDKTAFELRALGVISTHTPLARRDNLAQENAESMVISTHTPLARRDRLQARFRTAVVYFYSHASREA